MTILSKQKLRGAARLGAGLACFLAWSAGAQILLTNVMTVNVTPSGFSVIAAVSPAVTSSTSTVVSVFSDPGGVTNLAGQVGVELYPLNSGNPGATNDYSRLQSRIGLQQKSMALGLIYARISDCAPATTYYYQLQVSNTNGQSAFWPASGPLPAVTTASQNSFVLQSQQLLITLDDANPPGSIITLSTSNSSSVLAAVVGEGASSNQAFFNVNDLIAASGGTNYSPLGSQLFTAAILGSSSSGLRQTYSLIFSNNFSVGQSSSITLGALSATISIGSATVLAGNSGSVPISVNSQSALVGLSFVLSLPGNWFSSISLQSTSAALSAATLSVYSSNSVLLSFTAAAGMNLLGSQQIAQLNFTAASNQSSAFVPLLPQAVQGTNATAGLPNMFLINGGRVAIIGPQPMLDMQLVSNAPNLFLYGIPGQSYQIQSLAKLARSGSWSDFVRVPMTNLVQVITNLSRTAAAVYFRAYEFTSPTPIVDETYTAAGQDLLVLYGTPGQAYEFDYTTSLGRSWTVLDLVPLTNSFAFIVGLSETNRDLFYRYHKLNADPPILQASLSGTNRSLLAFGLVGTNYSLQTSTNLTKTVVWHPLLSYTLTNSFQFFTNPSAGSPVFYRIKKQ